VTRVLIAERINFVSAPPGEMASTHSIGLATTIAGRPVEFMFNWLPRYSYYTLDVVTNEDGLVGHYYPTVGEPIDIPGFTRSQAAPDISLLFLNTLRDGSPLAPENWGKMVFLVYEGTLDVADL
jgi:hypothetical protein